MSASYPSLRLLGYDPLVVARLPAEVLASLRNVAVAWLVSCAMLGAAAAYAGWLIVPHPLFPAAAGLGVFALALNLLRVVIAGGGVAHADSETARDAACSGYRPSWAPAAVMGVLGALLAQPAQLEFWSGRIDPQVEEHRRELLDAHAAAASALGTSGREASEELRVASFVVFRLKVLWQRPDKAIRWTALFVFLVILPDLWARLFALASIRAYQRERLRVVAVRVEGAREELARAQHRYLIRFPTYAASRGKESA